MEIIVARTAGFCFGVDKAVKTTYDMVEDNDNSGKTLYTFGPIIHNEQVVNQLKEKGVKVIDRIRDAEPGSRIIIRTHGIAPDVYEEIQSRELIMIDATCPYVKKIHNLVRQKHDEGYQIIIAGDREHPEIKGINGWCGNSAFVVNSAEDVSELPDMDKDICVVAQTTLTHEKWEIIIRNLEKKFKNVVKFDTICNATSKRQSEARELAAKVDMMIVIGGRNSSNTRKLYEICSKYCPETYYIEMPGDLPPIDISKYKRVGITAGASTPDWIIKEVIKKMDELNKQENELTFGEAFEQSLVTLRNGDVVKGKIIGFNKSEVFVDLGFKSDGYIPMEDFTDDPEFDPEQSLKIGDEVEVLIVRVNDGEGNVVLSKKKVDAFKAMDKIEAAYESKEAVNAKVVDVVKGGVIANAGGVRIFVPASQVSDRYVKDLKEFLRSNISVRIVEFNKQKRKIVGSARVIIEEEKQKAEDAIWSGIETGKKYEGVVKSFTDFGAFVDIGGVDGLIHISELSWTKVKHPSDVLKIGQKVEVIVLDFDREKKRISLGYRKAEDNPWYNAEEKYKPGEIVKGKVVRLVPFGAFLELEEGVDGLVHISQISNHRIAKPGDVLEIGQEVEAKITELNLEAKKISLSIKEVNPIDPVVTSQETKAPVPSDEEQLPTEHVEEMDVTIGDMTKSVDEQ